MQRTEQCFHCTDQLLLEHSCGSQLVSLSSFLRCFSDNLQKGSATKDIHPKQAGGIADAAAHIAFCGTSDACNVQRETRCRPSCTRASKHLLLLTPAPPRRAGIYDQSIWQNHLSLEGPAQRGHNINPLRNIQDLPVNFTDPRSKTTLHGEVVFAAFFAGAPAGFDGKPFIGQGYSNRSARGTAQGDESETLYAVMGNPKEPIPGRGNCCFVRLSLPPTCTLALAQLFSPD